MGLGVVGVQGDGVVVGLQGGLMLIKGGERVAAVVPGIGEVGLEAESAIASGHSFLVAMEGVKDAAAIVVDLGKLRVGPEGGVDAFECRGFWPVW